jgi:hypothetical protein
MKLGKTEVVTGSAAIILSSILVLCWSFRARSVRESNAILSAEEADVAAVLNFRVTIPAGSTPEQVRSKLEDRNLSVPEYPNNQLLLLQGTEPSQVWYCGPISRYVVFTFLPSPDGRPRLKSIERQTRGENCL